MKNTPNLAVFQIGKNGLTNGVIESISSSLKTHKQVRISVLKSACRDKKELGKMVDELGEKLPFKLKIRTIGYTIVLVKLRK